MISARSGNTVEAKLTAWNDIVDKRKKTNTDFRTTGAVYSLPEAGLEPVCPPQRVWTVDLCETGAVIKSYREINQSRILLDLLIPELVASVVEGRIVRGPQDLKDRGDGKHDDAFHYGVEFLRFVPRSSLPEKSAVPIEEIEIDPVGKRHVTHGSAVEDEAEVTQGMASIALQISFITLLVLVFGLVVWVFE